MLNEFRVAVNRTVCNKGDRLSMSAINYIQFATDKFTSQNERRAQQTKWVGATPTFVSEQTCTQ